MKWLVTGSVGMLGRDMVATLEGSDESVTAVDRSSLDITDSDEVLRLVDEHDVVVNCAAWTAVDLAEQREPDAFLANAMGPASLARACRATGARLVQISTDYVFAGDARTPYAADAAPAPRSAYGRTKVAGEWAVAAYAPDHLIVRTAWLYGSGGACFPRTIARVAAERGHVDVVDDQVGQPTWTSDLAAFVLRLVRGAAPTGIYHGTSAGQCTWYEFARAVVESAGMPGDTVRSITSAAFERSAPRPSYSVLGHGAAEDANIASIPDWRARWAAAASAVLG